jgi:hypothetical protein
MKADGRLRHQEEDLEYDPNSCDICAIRPGRGRSVLTFGLVQWIRTPEHPRTTRTLGAIHLCGHCWKPLGRRRRRSRPLTPAKLERLFGELADAPSHVAGAALGVTAGAIRERRLRRRRASE